MKEIARNRKKNRIKIKSYDEAINLLENKSIIKDEILRQYIDKENIEFKVDNKDDFIDYLNKLSSYEKEEALLYDKLNKIKSLTIYRTEFDRDQSQNKTHDYKEEKSITELKEVFDRQIEKAEILKLKDVEKVIKDNCIYSKDVELLKKILYLNSTLVTENYDEKLSLKTINIKIDKVKDTGYKKSLKGSVEYHKFLDNNLLRMKRLIKNIDRYLIKENEGIYSINQSKAIQDSINLALGYFNGEEFRAISGKNNIENFCKAPLENDCAFESFKVNKLGQIGYGYKRVNDSEKKIIEEINKKIESKELPDEGNLTLITKWQPCPSCYLVLKQFAEKYKKIHVIVKYYERYGGL